MSGVIDDDGQQWEHCNECNKFVRIQALLYEPASERYPHGRDLCVQCKTPSARPATPVLFYPHWTSHTRN